MLFDLWTLALAAASSAPFELLIVIFGCSELEPLVTIVPGGFFECVRRGDPRGVGLAAPFR